MTGKQLKAYGLLSLLLPVSFTPQAQTPFYLQINTLTLTDWLNHWGIHLLYGMLLVGMAGWFFHHRDRKRKQDRQEISRLKARHETASKFFIAITHELHTPLVLILGEIDQCLKQFKNTENDYKVEKLKSLKGTGKRMLGLVQQIFDLQKLQQGNLQMNWKNDNILPLLKFIVNSYEAEAQTRNISLVFETKLTGLFMDYDSDKFFTIVTNLLNHAFKSTTAGDRIVFLVQKTGDELEFQVKDSGKGISPEELPHIFNCFHREKLNSHPSGTCIGLTLVKELVEFMGGHINAESEMNHGTSFTVRLPIRSLYAKDEAQPEGYHFDYKSDWHLPGQPRPEYDEQPSSVANRRLPLLLIIENSREVTGFLASVLRHQYRLAFAENREQGTFRALEIVPDLIICDLTMVLHNSFELLSLLKNDPRTSPIPVILMTVNANFEDRLEGFRLGADAYLEKPFQEDELLVRVDQLLSQRKALQKHYTTLELPNEIYAGNRPEIPEFDLPLEDDFMQEVMLDVKKHFSNPDFGPSELCQHLAMSYSQLHRKLAAITDHTPVQLIRLERLAHATVLLKQPGISIADVAYDSGFKDPAYFSRIFSKVFGVSPSEYKELQDHWVNG